MSGGTVSWPRLPSRLEKKTNKQTELGNGHASFFCATALQGSLSCCQTTGRTIHPSEVKGWVKGRLIQPGCLFSRSRDEGGDWETQIADNCSIWQPFPDDAVTRTKWREPRSVNNYKNRQVQLCTWNHSVRNLKLGIFYESFSKQTKMSFFVIKIGVFSLIIPNNCLTSTALFWVFITSRVTF